MLCQYVVLHMVAARVCRLWIPPFIAFVGILFQHLLIYKAHLDSITPGFGRNNLDQHFVAVHVMHNYKHPTPFGSNIVVCHTVSCVLGDSEQPSL